MGCSTNFRLAKQAQRSNFMQGKNSYPQQDKQQIIATLLGYKLYSYNQAGYNKNSRL